MNYHALRESFTSHFPLVELGTLTLGEPDYGLSVRAVARTSENEPRYIRITDFGEDGIEPGHEFVTAESIESGYELHPNDVLFARSGSVGRTYIHEDLSPPAVFAGYCIRFRFDHSKVSPKFVYWWTKTDAYMRWVAAIQRTAAQPNINKEEYKGSLIPLPPIADQHRLIATMAAAQAERRAKLAEADALLAGIDDFLLDALGIVPPAENRLRAFAVSLAQMSGQVRLNSDYYHPERSQALRGLDLAAGSMTVAPLADVVNFEREQLKTPGDNYLSLAHVQGHTGELTEATDTASGNCFTFQTDDVLFARLRPYLNKVYCAEMNGCCSTEFHVLRVKDREALLPKYLAAVLRSRLVLAQTTHMMTGNTHPRLTNDDVANLTIPIPPPAFQETITSEIRRRRDEARRLRAEAEAGWESAKGWFQVQLLGSTGANQIGE